MYLHLVDWYGNYIGHIHGSCRFQVGGLMKMAWLMMFRLSSLIMGGGECASIITTDLSF